MPPIFGGIRLKDCSTMSLVSLCDLPHSALPEVCEEGVFLDEKSHFRVLIAGSS